MNVSDSDYMADHLLDSGLSAAESADKAALIVVNTCSVRQNAEHKALSYLGRITPFKKKNKTLKIVFAGCMAQRVGEYIKKRFPEIDLVVGAKDIEHFPRLLDELLKGATGNRRNASSKTKAIQSQCGFGNRQTRIEKAPVSALVTIMRGCENFCSYCVVPYVRGKEASRPKNEIIAEIEALAVGGAKEIMLVGQNVNSYRDDKTNFPKLLKLVNSVKGIERIRFMTSHPKDLDDELIDAMAGLDKVCEHLHLPLQSGSDRILKLMNRGYSFGKYLGLVNKLKEKVPDINFTTDILVGFPGETDKDFADTLGAIRTAGFDNLYAFKYSPRPGTAAASLTDDVPMEVKEKRLKEVLDESEKISSKKNAKLLNTFQELLVDKKQGEYLEGRTRGSKKIFFKGPERLIGKLVNVKVVYVKVNTLKGEIAAS